MIQVSGTRIEGLICLTCLDCIVLQSCSKISKLNISYTSPLVANSFSVIALFWILRPKSHSLCQFRQLCSSFSRYLFPAVSLLCGRVLCLLAFCSRRNAKPRSVCIRCWIMGNHLLLSRRSFKNSNGLDRPWLGCDHPVGRFVKAIGSWGLASTSITMESLDMCYRVSLRNVVIKTFDMTLSCYRSTSIHGRSIAQSGQKS